VGQGGFHDRAEVIGIVKDIRFGTVEELPQPDVFMSYLQAPRTSAIVYLQTSVAATTVLPQVRQVTRNLMGGMPIYDVRPMDERVRVATIRQRLTSAVLVGFAVSALLLSIIGIYALMAHEVSRRTREIGIRMSLGATAQRVTAMVFRRSALLTGIGLALGSMVALGATGLIRSMLFGVGRGDPVTYVGLIVLLGLAAGLATLVPARRAARIEPMTAIRTE
jgi:ABC-type antimicrobial peptide transport system permease subunit